MKLKPEQLKDFDEQGYLFFPNCFSEEEIALLRDDAEAILKLDRKEVWREKSGAPRTAFAAHTFNETFRLLACHPRLVEPLRQLFGEEVYVHQFKLNAKAAFEGDVWQWHQDYGTWARDDGMPEPRAMNIAVFLDEVMPINGALMVIPKSHKQGVLAAGHDTATTSYPLWTLDNDTVTRLAAARRHRGADRQARLGADVSRQSGARLAAEHHAFSAQDRLSDAMRLLQPHHQSSPGRNGSRTAILRRSCRWRTTRCCNMRGRIGGGGIDMNLQSLLAARVEAGKPVRVGLIGAGKFGSMFLAQVPSIEGLEVAVIADLDPERAKLACKTVGWDASRIARIAFCRRRPRRHCRRACRCRDRGDRQPECRHCACARGVRGAQEYRHGQCRGRCAGRPIARAQGARGRRDLFAWPMATSRR